MAETQSITIKEFNDAQDDIIVSDANGNHIVDSADIAIIAHSWADHERGDQVVFSDPHYEELRKKVVSRYTFETDKAKVIKKYNVLLEQTRDPHNGRSCTWIPCYKVLKDGIHRGLIALSLKPTASELDTKLGELFPNKDLVLTIDPRLEAIFQKYNLYIRGNTLFIPKGRLPLEGDPDPDKSPELNNKVAMSLIERDNKQLIKLVGYQRNGEIVTFTYDPASDILQKEKN